MVIDSYYPDVIVHLPVNLNLTYEQNLRKILDFSFGTFDAYSRNLRALGWDARDVIYNHIPLQQMWARDRRLISPDNLILLNQVFDVEPDVMFYQDLSVGLVYDSSCKSIMAGQLSCPWPGDEIVKQFDILYTSFPHYVSRIEALGVRAVYNPLAFDPIVERRVAYRWVGDEYPKHREHDVVFIGGVGAPSHWKYGMEVLETVAREIPTFKWWGYGVSELPANSALRGKYMGEAWGLDMYEILLQSKIVLNRHGEVAEGYANNMRMYEATGCGAMLLTEEAKQLGQLFGDDEIALYESPAEAVAQINYYLAHPAEMEFVSMSGQRRTLRDHTYKQRMQTVSTTLLEMLCPA